MVPFEILKVQAMKIVIAEALGDGIDGRVVHGTACKRRVEMEKPLGGGGGGGGAVAEREWEERFGREEVGVVE